MPHFFLPSAGPAACALRVAALAPTLTWLGHVQRDYDDLQPRTYRSARGALRVVQPGAYCAARPARGRGHGIEWTVMWSESRHRPGTRLFAVESGLLSELMDFNCAVLYEVVGKDIDLW